ncbi:MAG: DUF3786 domain-containing protein [Pseudomonadota bacterium]
MVQILEQDNYQVALDLAKQQLASLDPETQARRCGCGLEHPGVERHIEVPYTDLVCRISIPDGNVTIAGSDDPLSMWEQILVLHYIGSTGDAPEEEEDPIAFSQVPSGAFYDSAFQQRVKNHFLSVFAKNPGLLKPAAEKLGGVPFKGGDTGVRIPAFPRVGLYFSLWKADEEFPADMSLLLSSNIASFLSTEDIAVLGGLVAGKLIKHAKKIEV